MPPLIPKSQADKNRVAGRVNPWDPKYPDAAVSPEQGTYDQPLTGGAPYEPAPATSHVYGFRRLALTQKFVRGIYAPSVGAPAGTVAVLQVAFKPSPKRKGEPPPSAIKSEYNYFFSDAAVAEKYLNDFRTAAHPGHVVQALERAGVPYKKVAGR